MKPDHLAWRRKPELEYRWRCGQRTGRWYGCYRAAGDAAEKAGLASWGDNVLFTGPLVEIEARRRRK